MRVLIYGAGVIGSIYAVRFAAAGHEVDVCARGRRLQELSARGLLYRDARGAVQSAAVNVRSEVEDDDLYDFILLPVQSAQIASALRELRSNRSRVIVTMANTASPYEEWEEICGFDRILPAFPGAGGSIDDGILDGELTPRFVQPTTFGALRPSGYEAERRFGDLLRSARIPHAVCRRMQDWQISHLGLVVPLANAYYASPTPDAVHRDRYAMTEAARALRSNFRELAKRGVLQPLRFHLIRILPIGLIRAVLTKVYASPFADKFMYRHSKKASNEMLLLQEQLERYLSS